MNEFERANSIRMESTANGSLADVKRMLKCAGLNGAVNESVFNHFSYQDSGVAIKQAGKGVARNDVALDE